MFKGDKMDVKEKRLMIKKAGGNSGYQSFAYLLNMPTVWIKKMGITPDDRDIILTLDEENGKITIKKVNNESTSSKI